MDRDEMRQWLNRLENYREMIDLPDPPDADPVLEVGWWQSLIELVDAKKWAAVERGRDESVSWDDLGIPLGMSGDSVRQAIRVRKNRGDL